MLTPVLRLHLPEAPVAAVRAALTDAAALRRWWDPDAAATGESVSPGLDAAEMVVAATDEAVTWSGELLTARFDLAAGELAIAVAPGMELDAGDAAELRVALEGALGALAWALGVEGPVTWRRLELPLALAYTDAWGRIAGPEGLAAGPAGARVPVRIAGQRVEARVLGVSPPRLVVLDLGRVLLRVAFGPGESVNAARVDALTAGEHGVDLLPAGWEPWITRRLGMSWAAQLGEEV